MISFFLHLIFGAIVSVIFWVLRLIESTRSGSKVAAWFIRLIPSFSFAFGILNLSNVNLYAAIEGSKTVESAYSFNISGGDILMLGIEGFVYMFLVFVIEKLEDSGSL